MARLEMTEDQREAARARMAKARAARMAKIQERAGTVAISALEPLESTNAPDLMLTIRRLRVGSFTGLWELCRINPDGSRTVVSDANTKQIIINLARNEILKCGQ